MEVIGLIERQWERYERYRSTRLVRFDAMVAMACVISYMETYELSGRETQVWANRLAGVEWADRDIQRAFEEARDRASTTCRILEGGGPFQYEEAVLLLGRRVDIELFLMHLHRIRPGAEVPLDLPRLDAALREAEKSRANHSAFKSARAAIARNSGLRIGLLKI